MSEGNHKNIGNVPPACYEVSVLNPSRFWQTNNVLKSELPILAMQISFAVSASRLYFFIFKSQHQPRIIAHISAGFILCLLGVIPGLFEFLYPVSGVINVEVLSNIGLVYYAFLSGLEMNLNTILHARKKAATIAVSGIIFPLVMGPALYALHRKIYVSSFILEEGTNHAYILWTCVLTVTGFPVLAHTLSELKLLHTGLGKTALTTAMVSDTYSWILFTMLFPFAVNGELPILSVLSTIVFVLVCIFVLRPIIVCYIDHMTEQDSWDDYQILYVVLGVFVSSFITDFLGTHAIVGAFVYGLILPHGKFADLVIAISDDFGSGFMAPLYFAGTGMRLAFMTAIFFQPKWYLTLLVVLLLCLPKILSTLISTFFFGMRTRDGLALGLLLNTKDALAFIMLNNAWDRKIFSVPTYTVMTSAILLMTVVVSPVINAMYKPRKRFEQNKLKTIQKLRHDAELRILACVHNTRHANSMINILDTFNPTRLSPMHVFGVYLVELTGRAAALVAAYIEKPNFQLGGEQNLTRTQAELEAITNTFEAFGEAYGAVRVEALNVVSSYATIHEDIHNTANEKRASLILLPFHKQLTSEGALEATSSVYKDINQNVMQGAPCSVGIFVDRDLGSLSNMNFNIIVIFVGGPDDREALAIAGRMAGHPRIRVLVVRILLFDDAAEVDTTSHAEAQGILSALMDNKVQKELDDEYVSSFRLTVVNNDESISYSEIDVHTTDDIPAVLNKLEKNGCDLYIVGQGNCRNSRVFSNLLEWCDCSELGVIGDILASKDFGSHASVLVVQQYGYGGMVFEKQLNNMVTTNDGFESLVVKTQ